MKLSSRSRVYLLSHLSSGRVYSVVKGTSLAACGRLGMSLLPSCWQTSATEALLMGQQERDCETALPENEFCSGLNGTLWLYRHQEKCLFLFIFMLRRKYLFPLTLGLDCVLCAPPYRTLTFFQPSSVPGKLRHMLVI